MAVKDTLLCLDLSFEDCLYRICRDDNGSKRVVYVAVMNLEIIPEQSRTYGPDVIRELSKLKEWYDMWDTITVYKDQTGIRTELDAFEPHALSEQQILGNYELFDILELPVVQSLKTRVFRIELKGRRCYLKIARFGFELGWLAQEIQVYHLLYQYSSKLSPRILGYAFEQRSHRVIGFVIEEVIGRRPSITDFETCKVALQELHDLDIIHGDINRDNIFITNEGARFIDFEETCIDPAENRGDWDKKKSDEMDSLEEKLLDESGKGRPWATGNAE
ncbi:hypothetical protein PRK78_003157 [Emydomyces testavorans]|uniref:Aminoglycoside phosphotransferase domain-containing protein n=1 Tax=Emydomyces testavorans TaxID=2070801 RepID=A0AAF0DFN8_9EURO|nr:hypothetical protein PRK78_003157 [Emydomyces testavorans]